MRITETFWDGKYPIETVVGRTSMEGDDFLLSQTVEAWQNISPWNDCGYAVEITTDNGFKTRIE